MKKELLLNEPLSIKAVDNKISTVDYSSSPQADFCKDWSTVFEDFKKNVPETKFRQKNLFEK